MNTVFWVISQTILPLNNHPGRKQDDFVNFSFQVFDSIACMNF